MGPAGLMVLNPAERPFGRAENPRRPTREFMERCMAGVGPGYDPGAVCGAAWYRKMGRAQKAKWTRGERRRNIADPRQDWLNSVSVLVEELKGMKLSPAASAYLGAMRQAYAEYGLEGLRVQLLYLWGNVRATTPRLKELKREIKRLAENVPNPGRLFHQLKALDYQVRARALRDHDPAGAAEALAVAESEKENWQLSRSRRRNPWTWHTRRSSHPGLFRWTLYLHDTGEAHEGEGRITFPHGDVEQASMVAQDEADKWNVTLRLVDDNSGQTIVFRPGKARRRNPYTEIERKQVVYHSPEWESLVEAGWITWTVQEWDGQRIANMIRQTRRNPETTGWWLVEFYTRHPRTGEGGWDIQFAWVKARREDRARALMRSVPHFDEIITINEAVQPQHIDYLGRDTIWMVDPLPRVVRNPGKAWHQSAAREYARKVKSDEAAGHAGAEEYWSGALAAESKALALEENPMRGAPTAAWMIRFWKAWARRNGVERHQLEAGDQARIASQAAALHAVGFTADRAAWMATPMMGEPGWRARNPGVSYHRAALGLAEANRDRAKARGDEEGRRFWSGAAMAHDDSVKDARFFRKLAQGRRRDLRVMEGPEGPSMGVENPGGYRTNPDKAWHSRQHDIYYLRGRKAGDAVDAAMKAGEFQAAARLRRQSDEDFAMARAESHALAQYPVRENPAGHFKPESARDPWAYVVYAGEGWPWIALVTTSRRKAEAKAAQLRRGKYPRANVKRYHRDLSYPEEIVWTLEAGSSLHGQSGIKENPAGYLEFHGSEPDKAYKVKVPDGFPRKMWALGTLHKLVTDRGTLRGGFVAAGSGDKVYIIRASGRAGGRAKQIEYVPPAGSRRSGATYYHPFKRPPLLVPAGAGCYTLRGPYRVTARGIVG